MLTIAASLPAPAAGEMSRPRTQSDITKRRQRRLRTALGAAPALAAALILGCATAAHAAPPPVGSDDYQIMHPFAEWVTSQHDRRGYWCCDIGDGRPVEARIVDDHWEVHITPAHFPDQPDHWLAVPEGKITPGGNPTGAPIVWLLHGNVQCFAPPDGA